MTSLNKALLCGLMAMVLGACEKDSGYRVKEYKEIKFDELADDVKVPNQAWSLVDHSLGDKSSDKNIVFSGVSLFLVQKNDGVVEGDAIKVSFPKGGGSIDLSRFITKKRGSFYLGFEFPQFEGAQAQKVIFVSNARKRKVGGQIFGAGCNQILDITTRFTEEMKDQGIKLNTTQERYVGVVGGTFIFSAQHGNDVYLAQVTIKNSEFKTLFCEER